MKKSKAIELLVSEGWTKADANRALEIVDFKLDPDELSVRRAISLFAGIELIHRQRLQAAQKAMLTKKDKELEQYKQVQKPDRESETKIQDLLYNNKTLEATVKSLTLANDRLKKDNKDLKNIVDRIKLQIAIDMKKLLQYQDSEIRQAAIKLFKSTLG